MAPDRTTPEGFQPPRPPNSWIIYRSYKIKSLPAVAPGAPRRSQGEVSRMISLMWRKETEAVKADFERRADLRKAEHQARYPGYRFKPVPKAKKVNKPKESKAKKAKNDTPYPTTPAFATGVPVPTTYSYTAQNHPSPPLSAASSTVSSPNIPTLSLEPQGSLRGHSIASSASSLINTPSSAGHALPPLTAPDWSQQPFSWDSSTTAGPSAWRQEVPPATHQEGPPYVSFGMPQLPQPQFWNNQDTSMEFVRAVLSGAGDQSLFELPIDQSMLTNGPTGQFDISYAPIEDPFNPILQLPPFEHNNAYYGQQEQAYQSQEHQQHLDEPVSQAYAEAPSYLDFDFQLPEELYNSNDDEGSSSQVLYV